MSGSDQDQALAAFRRLMLDATESNQAKVDALVAFGQRTCWVATWTSMGDDYRTLVNSNGESALPVFSGKDQMEEASNRFGWTAADGTVPHKEVGAREVLRHAIAHALEYVVVDIASGHSLEIEKSEIEPLLNSGARKDSQGPYAAVGKISTDMMRAVEKRSSAPATADFNAPAEEVPKAPRVPSVPSPPADGDVGIFSMGRPPPDEVLDGLASVLREYPEVEWASVCLVGPEGGELKPHVAMRVDASFTQRVPEITEALQSKANELGHSLGVLQLVDNEQVRTARSEGTVFYPWRK